MSPRSRRLEPEATALPAESTIDELLELAARPHDLVEELVRETREAWNEVAAPGEAFDEQDTLERARQIAGLCTSCGFGLGDRVVLPALDAILLGDVVDMCEYDAHATEDGFVERTSPGNPTRHDKTYATCHGVLWDARLPADGSLLPDPGVKHVSRLTADEDRRLQD